MYLGGFKEPVSSVRTPNFSFPYLKAFRESKMQHGKYLSLHVRLSPCIRQNSNYVEECFSNKEESQNKRSISDMKCHLDVISPGPLISAVLSLYVMECCARPSQQCSRPTRLTKSNQTITIPNIITILNYTLEHYPFSI